MLMVDLTVSTAHADAPGRVSTSELAAPAPFFDAFPELFDRFTAVWDGIDEGFGRWLAAQIPRGGGRLAADLGCGAGRHTVILAEHYQQVLAVDIAERILDVARRTRSRPNVSYLHRSVLDVTRAEGPFDLVLSVHTLHHVGDPGTVLRHVRSLLAPGGVAVLADIVNPGGWTTPEFHLDRAFDNARVVYQITGDQDQAADIMRLLLHPRWLQLAATDTPLTREEFHRVYTAALPGAVFADDLHPMMCGAVWRAPS
jgi:SAM-dependent methyltransferase